MIQHSIIANTLQWAEERFLQERYPSYLLRLKFDTKSAGIILAAACREMTIWKPFA